MPQACQGLGEPQSQGACIPASRLNPSHAPKTLQSSLMFPDGLLGSINDPVPIHRARNSFREMRLGDGLLEPRIHGRRDTLGRADLEAGA